MKETSKNDKVLIKIFHECKQIVNKKMLVFIIFQRQIIQNQLKPTCQKSKQK